MAAQLADWMVVYWVVQWVVMTVECLAERSAGLMVAWRVERTDLRMVVTMAALMAPP